MKSNLNVIVEEEGLTHTEDLVDGWVDALEEMLKIGLSPRSRIEDTLDFLKHWEQVYIPITQEGS